MGYILHIDLTTMEVHREALPERYVEQFLGGAGINYRIAVDLIRPNVEPLSPENAIILGAGAFAGTNITSASKLSVTTNKTLIYYMVYDKIYAQSRYPQFSFNSNEIIDCQISSNGKTYFL